MLRFASLMRSAITRRTPITLISDVSAETSARSAPRAGAVALAGASRSLRIMRPPGPDPVTLDKSIPASRARRRLAGEVITRPVRAAEAGVLALGAACAAAAGFAGAGLDGAAAAGAALAASPVSN